MTLTEALAVYLYLIRNSHSPGMGEKELGKAWDVITREAEQVLQDESRRSAMPVLDRQTSDQVLAESGYDPNRKMGRVVYGTVSSERVLSDDGYVPVDDNVADEQRAHLLDDGRLPYIQRSVDDNIALQLRRSIERNARMIAVLKEVRSRFERTFDFSAIKDKDTDEGLYGLFKMVDEAIRGNNEGENHA